jgi:hypothetical protein
MVERSEPGGESVKLEGGEARGGVVFDVEAAAAGQDRLAWSIIRARIHG